MNHQYSLFILSFLKKDHSQPLVQNEKKSVKSGYLLHDNARAHTASMTAGILEKHVETLCCALSTLPLARSDFHLFSPLKEALGENRFITDDENILFNDGLTSNQTFFEMA
jgi:hypothetical protein